LLTEFSNSVPNKGHVDVSRVCTVMHYAVLEAICAVYGIMANLTPL